MEAFFFPYFYYRVPLLAISPRIRAGTLVSSPPRAQRPFPSSQYEHTSMMATMRKLFGINASLTRRDNWAATFEHILDDVIYDKPLTAPPPPPPTRSSKQEHHLPVNDLQAQLVRWHDLLLPLHSHRHRSRQGDLDFSGSFEKIKHSLQSFNFPVYLAPDQAFTKYPNRLDIAWVIESSRIRTATMSDAHKTHLCATMNSSSLLRATPCSPVARDQDFVYAPDFTIRPLLNSSLCWTVQEPIAPNDPRFFGQRPVALSPCIDTVQQHFAYSGLPGKPYPGAPFGDGSLMFGTGLLGVFKEPKQK